MVSARSASSSLQLFLSILRLFPYLYLSLSLFSLIVSVRGKRDIYIARPGPSITRAMPFFSRQVNATCPIVLYNSSFHLSRNFPSFACFPVFIYPTIVFSYSIYDAMLQANGFSVRTIHYRLVCISFASFIFFSLPNIYYSLSLSFSLSLSLFSVFFRTYSASLAFRPQSAPLPSSLFLFFLSSYPAVFESRRYICNLIACFNTCFAKKIPLSIQR